MLLAHYVSDVGAGLVLGVALDKVVGRLLAFVRAGGDRRRWRWLRNPRMRFPQPTYFGRNRYWLLSHLFAWEAERAARGRVAAFLRSFPRRKAPEEAR
jgi:hypothetical protein